MTGTFLRSSTFIGLLGAAIGCCPLAAVPYRITNVASGKVLSIEFSAGTPGAPVIQWDWLNALTQKWNIVPVGNGYSYIQNLNSPGTEVLDVSGISFDENARVWQWGWVYGLNQQWLVDPIPNSNYFRLVNLNSQKVLDVEGSSLDNYGYITQTTWAQKVSQQWLIEPLDAQHNITQSVQVFAGPDNNGVYSAEAIASVDDDYESQYNYLNLISVQISVNGVGVKSNCHGCSQPTPPPNRGFDYPFVGFGSISTWTGALSAGDYVEAESDAVVFAGYTQSQVILPCADICNYWYDPFDYVWASSILNRLPEETEASAARMVMYITPTVITAVSVIKDVLRKSTKASTVVPGTRDIFALTTRSFIPFSFIYGAGIPADFCWATSPAPNMEGVVYGGDDRSFSPYLGTDRVSSRITLSAIGGSAVAGPFDAPGTVHRYAQSAVQSDGTLLTDTVLHDCYRLDNELLGSSSIQNVVTSGGIGIVYLHQVGQAHNLTSTAPDQSPGIDWDFALTIDVISNSQLPPQFRLVGTHDCFPAFEMYSGLSSLYKYMPQRSDTTFLASCLSGVNAKSINIAGSIQ